MKNLELNSLFDEPSIHKRYAAISCLKLPLFHIMSGTVYLNISRYTCDAFLLLHQLSNTLFLGGGAASAPYGSSQARGPIGATAAEPTPQPQQCQIPALSLTYTTAHGNVRSLTH